MRSAIVRLLIPFLLLGWIGAASSGVHAQTRGSERRIGILAQDLQPGLLETFRDELHLPARAERLDREELPSKGVSRTSRRRRADVAIRSSPRMGRFSPRVRPIFAQRGPASSGHPPEQVVFADACRVFDVISYVVDPRRSGTYLAGTEDGQPSERGRP